jgi:hypothetical protein
MGCAASTTRRAQSRPRRSAKGAVKLVGMCCATTTGQGKCAGSCGKMRSSVRGPPVDTPITTTPGWRASSGTVEAQAGSAGSAGRATVRPAVRVEVAVGAIGPRTLALAAPRAGHQFGTASMPS